MTTIILTEEAAPDEVAVGLSRGGVDGNRLVDEYDNTARAGFFLERVPSTMKQKMFLSIRHDYMQRMEDRQEK